MEPKICFFVHVRPIFRENEKRGGQWFVLEFPIPVYFRGGKEKVRKEKDKTKRREKIPLSKIKQLKYQ